MTAAQSSCDDPWNGTAGEMRAAVADLFRREGASESDALDAASRVVQMIAFLFGGRSTYLPRLDRFKVADRHRMIYAECNGKNKHELAKRFGITARHVERIVAQQARAYRAERAAIQKRNRMPPDDVQ